MKRTLIAALSVFLVLAAFSCSSSNVSSKMNFYHGQTIPDQFFKVVGYTAEGVSFEIKVDFKSVHMYHVLLDASGKPVAEGWYPTAKIGQAYKLTMKLKQGFRLQEGDKYRLCIGSDNPEEIFVTSSNYQCVADYEFVLGKK